MEKYIKIIADSFTGYFGYLKSQVLFQYGDQPWYENYFYWLILLSLLVWSIEIIIPWREKQSVIRKDFWLDGFYMFFNMFLFSLIAYNAVSNVFVELFNDFLGLFGITNLVAIHIENWPVWGQFLLMFIVADFLQWSTHVLLHRVPWLWEFHKVHHSVKEMGFAAHLRYHWMETIVYKSIQYIPLTMIGFGLKDFFVLHMFNILIGHLNHANVGWDYGPLKYILNNPKMHIWHHAKHLPKARKYGVNYGITLSIWDYIFGSNYIPESGRDIELGFPGDDDFPQDFVHQVTYPMVKEKANGQKKMSP